MRRRQETGSVKSAIIRRSAVAGSMLLMLMQATGAASAEGAEVARRDHPALLCRHADGRLTIAVPDARPPAAECRSVALPIPADDVRWVGALPRAVAPARDRLVLSGSGRGAGFVPAGIGFEEPPGPRPRPAPLAIGRSLIPGLAARTFGVEERASLSRTDAAVTLHCRPGEKPAGLVLDPGHGRLPDGAHLSLRWQATGESGFSAAIAAPGTDGESVMLPAGGTLALPLPREEALRASPLFVLACPTSAAALTLLDLRLAAAPEAGARTPSRSAWAWRPRRWREAPDSLVAEALALTVDRLFVTAEIDGDGVVDEAAFSHFVGLASASGIGVVVVEGDPAMALDEGRATAIRRLGALVAYQRRAAAGRRLAGVQYDIEPYLLPGFQADPTGILRGWARTLDGLSAAAAPLDLDLVLPFWLPLHESAGLVMPAIGRVARRVTVMAYRTNPDDILASAEPMLAWAGAASLPVHVAVEAGPVGDETTRIYGRAETGDLLLLPQPGGDALVLLLAAPISLEARLYAQERESVVPGSRVSFLGDRTRLDDAVTRLSPGLSAWPSFSGFALHGVID